MLIGYIRDALGEGLPDDLVARAEENVMLAATQEAVSPRRKADVAVVETAEAWRAGQTKVWQPEDDTNPTHRLAEPVLVELDDLTPRWVEIRSAQGRLVTVIEVLSPANKSRTGRTEFEKKLREYLQAGVSVMEIDLIRGGWCARDVRTSGSWPEEPCQIIVSRAHHPGFCEVYPCPLRQPLPAVRVPLRDGEPDAVLDLQPLVDRCYVGGRYWLLPYHQPPSPALTGDDLAWARDRLIAAGIVP